MLRAFCCGHSLLPEFFKYFNLKLVSLKFRSQKKKLITPYKDAGQIRGGKNPPVITNFNGKSDKAFKFEMGRDTFASLSCSMSWKNQFYLFGGDLSYNKQISRLDKCRLSRVGSLDFPFHYSGCANMANKKLFLCFDMSYLKTCYYSTDPLGKFKKTSDSFHSHRHIKIASSNSK